VFGEDEALQSEAEEALEGENPEVVLVPFL
jgi:hypothetical protein